MTQTAFKWKDFIDQRIRGGTPDASPRVSVQRKGNIGLNKSAYEALGKPEAVVLRYDEDRRAFALCRASKGTPGARPVRQQNAANSWVIGAKAFADFMGLSGKLRSFRPQVSDGMLVVVLGEADSDGSNEA